MNKPWIATAVAAVFLSPWAAAEQKTLVDLAGAWVRALPPTQTNTAAYLTVTNRGATAITIVGASAEVAGKVELHTRREIDGYTRMEQLQDLPVAAGQSLQLAPGGTHLMLLGLARMPLSGEAVHLCLQLATGDEVCTIAEVRKTAGTLQAQGHH